MKQYTVETPNGPLVVEGPEDATDDELINFAKSQMQQTSEQGAPEEMGMGESAIRGASQGATVGFGDEIGSGISAVRKKLTSKLLARMTGEDKTSFYDDTKSVGDYYSQYVDEARTDNTQSREDNPATHMASEFIPAMAMGVTGALKSGVPLTGRALAGIGAGEGAIAGYGYSEADSLAGDAGNTALGAGFGGAMGYYGPKVAKAIGNTAKKAFAPQSNRAASTVIEDLKKAGYTPSEAQAYLKKNPEMITADLGENLKYRTADVATSPGQGAEDLKGLLSARNESQLEGRLEPFFVSALGGNATEGFEKTLQRAQADLSAQAKPLYDEASQIAVSLTDDMKAVLNTRTGKEALERAARKAEDDNVAFGPGMNTRLLHYTGRALNDMADEVGRYTDRGGQFMAMRGKIIDGVKQQNEPFRLAQSLYSDGKSVQDAFEEGVTALNGNALVKVDRIKDLSEAEKVAMRSGLFQGVLQKMGATVETGDASRFFKKPNVKKIIKAAMDDPGQYAAFEAMVSRESTMSELSNVVLNGSRTKPLMSFAEDGLDAATTLATGGGDLGAGIARFAGRKAMDLRGEKFRNELSGLLGSNGNNLVDLLAEKGKRAPVSQGLIRGSAGASSGLTPELLRLVHHEGQ